MTRGAAVLALLLVPQPAALAAAAARQPACNPAQFEGSGFTVCRYEPGRDKLELRSHDSPGAPGSLAMLKRALGRGSRAVAFAMNAGMYDTGQRPLGLFVVKGRTAHAANTRAGGGNFHLLPNGVFWVDRAGAAHVSETRAFLAAPPRARWATQSGPLLLNAGQLHPAIAADGPSRLVRNGVGVANGRAAFVISEGPVSFGRFARLFRDRLGCRDALYLDGNVSSLWDAESGRLDAYTGLGTFVVVTRPEPRP